MSSPPSSPAAYPFPEPGTPTQKLLRDSTLCCHPWHRLVRAGSDLYDDGASKHREPHWGGGNHVWDYVSLDRQVAHEGREAEDDDKLGDDHGERRPRVIPRGQVARPMQRERRGREHARQRAKIGDETIGEWDGFPDGQLQECRDNGVRESS